MLANPFYVPRRQRVQSEKAGRRFINFFLRPAREFFLHEGRDLSERALRNFQVLPRSLPQKNRQSTSMEQSKPTSSLTRGSASR